MPPDGDGHALALARAREYVRSIESSAARVNAPTRASWAGGATTVVPSTSAARAPNDALASPVKPRPNLKFFGNTMRAITSANARIDEKRRASEDEGARERETKQDDARETSKTRQRQSDGRDRRRSKKRRGGKGVDADRWDHVPQKKARKTRTLVVKSKPTADEREEGELSSGSDA